VTVLKLTGLAALGLIGCSHSPKPARYVLESGSTGWVKIKYNLPDGPELPVQDGFEVVRIPAYLTVVTKNHMNPSWEGAEFYYRSPDGKLVRLASTDDKERRIWAMEKTSDSGGDREVFYVGKEEQFSHLKKSGFFTVPDPAAAKSAETADEPDLKSDHMKIETSLPK
jgi:hypothetical protein